MAEPAPVAAGGATPEVSVIVVTYNSAEVIEPFLLALPDALEGIRSARVVVVDNDSGDESIETVRRTAPWVTMIDAGRNLGYAGGINLGLRHVHSGGGAMILNPDTIPGRGSIARLLAAVASDGTTGIAVPRIVNPAGELSFSLRREPTVLRALGEAVLGGRRAARFSMLGETIRTVDSYVDGMVADWATGAAMFVSRRAFDAAGLWAEDYFLYSEETDFALRVRDAGLNLRFVADAEVVHRGGEMSSSPWLWSLRAVNRTRLYRRRHGRAASTVFWSAVLLNEGIRCVTGRPTHRAAVHALVRGHPRWTAGQLP